MSLFDRLSRVTPPVGLAVSLADVKSYLRVDFADDDATITRHIETAIAMIDGPDGIGYALDSQTWRLDLDCFADGFLSPRWRDGVVLPLRPVTAVTTIEYVDPDGIVQTFADTTVHLTDRHAIVRPAAGFVWPTTADHPDAVSITFVAGTGAPPQLAAAILLIVKGLYDGAVGAEAVPVQARWYLDQFRLQRSAA